MYSEFRFNDKGVAGLRFPGEEKRGSYLVMTKDTSAAQELWSILLVICLDKSDQMTVQVI
jgi:hypothetical protein